jgi:hypothetical protein
VQGAAGALALAVAVLPRRRTPVQVAALGAGVTIAVQLGITHWFYLYIVWFTPLVLVALFGPRTERPPETVSAFPAPQARAPAGSTAPASAPAPS